QDDQRALLDEIDRREREREEAEARATGAAAVASTAPAAEQPVLNARDPNLFSEVLFAQGKSDFSEGDVHSLRDALPQLVSLMQRAPKMRVEVVGYADPKTEHANADKLAAARALSVHAYLIRNGISPKRSARSSQGASRPVVLRGDSSRNRRVEILVYAE
ncbi:MAG TPA: OmpA family protein, partial [Nevskiaceae bacterium]|nr:OmpA family protein [Nevskiaceae bacterium]